MTVKRSDSLPWSFPLRPGEFGSPGKKPGSSRDLPAARSVVTWALGFFFRPPRPQSLKGRGSWLSRLWSLQCLGLLDSLIPTPSHLLPGRWKRGGCENRLRKLARQRGGGGSRAGEGPSGCDCHSVLRVKAGIPGVGCLR